ncbi:hypothetical protein HW555_007939 [Spodoptera exigua]|uniref:Uncharacterized protein n=1 Tax=Spodoptera exigua TaxID=7107 RepID=A0A835L8C1_SPOEX|nr:hypothetical protein HW555_007939 [Spodoptera exigua]
MSLLFLDPRESAPVSYETIEIYFPLVLTLRSLDYTSLNHAIELRNEALIALSTEEITYELVQFYKYISKNNKFVVDILGWKANQT